MKDSYINIKKIAEAKGLRSTRSIRLELNKVESKYISREVKVNGGTSYEILFSSLEPEVGFEDDGRSGSGLKFALDEAQKEDFIQEIGTQILKAQQITNKKVALLCPKHFRLVIYRMLSEPLPDIIVLAEEEIQSGFKVEEV